MRLVDYVLDLELDHMIIGLVTTALYIVKNALIELNHFIGIVKGYYGPLQQVYLIFTSELPDFKPGLALHMSFKAINNLVSLNKLVSTLLISDVYSKMTELNASIPSISQLVMAIKKAMDEV